MCETWKSKDRGVWEEFYLLHHDALLELAMALTATLEDAEDLVHDAWLEAWENADKIDDLLRFLKATVVRLSGIRERDLGLGPLSPSGSGQGQGPQARRKAG